jgi:calcineurin-like phosphoesterase family protein
MESIVAMPAVKVAFTSDLHLPITTAERIGSLMSEVSAFAPDALVVAGDLAERPAELVRCLKIVREAVTCPVWVLAGNHDLWAHPPYDSHRLWRERLPEAVAEAGCRLLEGTGFVVGGTAVAGTIAWYDYSAADPTIQGTALEFAQKKMLYNADALRIDWGWSDPEFAERVSKPFLATLDDFQLNPLVKRIVAVTHVPLLEEQIYRDHANRDWGFSNAYFGNLTLGRRVLERSKVSHVISGHTHIGRQARVTRPGAGAVDAVVLASDYEKPSWLGLTFTES